VPVSRRPAAEGAADHRRYGHRPIPECCLSPRGDSREMCFMHVDRADQGFGSRRPRARGAFYIVPPSATSVSAREGGGGTAEVEPVRTVGRDLTTTFAALHAHRQL